MASLIGALRVTLSADTAAFEKGMTRAQRQAASSSTAIQRSMGAIKASVAGLVAGLSVGMFVNLGREALQFAGGLGEIARQTGTTVEQYQILTRAAIANGVEQGKLDAALKKLNITFGEAQGGSAKATKAFAQLGIKKEHLDSYQRGGDLIPLVAEGVKKMATEAQGAAAANGVMGKGASALLPILVQGADGYNQMAEEARAAGLITTEQAERADEASDKIDLLAYSVKTNLSAAFIEIIPVIESVIATLSRVISTTSNAIAYLDELASRNGGSGLGGVIKGALRGHPVFGPMVMAVESLGGGQGRPKPVRPKPVIAGTNTLDLSGPGKKPPRGRRGKSAEQLAAEAERARKEALRDEYQFASDQRRNQFDILRAQLDLAHDYVERTSLSVQILDAEREQERAALAHAVAMGDMTHAQASQLDAQHDTLDALKRRQLLEEEQYQRSQEVAQIEQGRMDIERDQLDAHSQLAQTAAERRDVELRILDLAYRQEKARLEAVLADERATAVEKELARQRLGSMGGRYAADRQGVMQGTMGPMEAYMATLPRTAAQINEAFEAVAAGGIASIVDGLADAASGARSLGSVFKNVARQIIADLIRIQIQKTIVSALAQVSGFFGGAPVAGGGASTGKLPGFATGGSFTINGRRGFDTNLLSLNGIGIARVSHGERVAISPDNDNGGKRPILFDLRGAVMTQDLVDQMNMIGAQAAEAGASIGEARVLRRVSRRSL